MPLHGHYLAFRRPGISDGLNRPILRANGQHLQIIPQRLNGLVVNGIDFGLWFPSIDSIQYFARRKLDFMADRIVQARISVSYRRVPLGRIVLIQGPAEIHVHQLKPPAYAQDWLAAPYRKIQYFQLILIPIRIAWPLSIHNGCFAIGLW